MFVFWIMVGLLAGWWFIPQPQWAISLKEKLMDELL